MSKTTIEISLRALQSALRANGLRLVGINVTSDIGRASAGQIEYRFIAAAMPGNAMNDLGSGVPTFMGIEINARPK